MMNSKALQKARAVRWSGHNHHFVHPTMMPGCNGFRQVAAGSPFKSSWRSTSDHSRARAPTLEHVRQPHLMDEGI